MSLAVNGQEALDWLVAHPSGADLVLMDVQMPVLDGVEATRQLRRMPQFADLPIVALTAGAFKAQQDAAHEAGMTHFISKPFDVPSTIALIQRLTRSKAQLPAAEARFLVAPGLPVLSALERLPVPPKLRHEAIDSGVLDQVKGLEIWLDLPAYHDYLGRFVTQYGHAVLVMTDSLRRADRPAAVALAHKLAGVAANMALPQTQRLAIAAERVLRTELDPARELAQLEEALKRAVSDIECLLASAN
ncbi:response regulator [Roseateles sp. GG27B]